MNQNLLPVKPFQETLGEGMCGPASLKMVFYFYGIDKTEKELAEICKTTKNLGTDAMGIQKAAKSMGLSVEIKNDSTFEDVQMWLDKKAPVIVNWFSRGRTDYDNSMVADGHYSVAIGLDENFIYLQDPEIGGLRKISRNDFLKVWFDFTGQYIKPGELVIRQLIAIYQ